MKRIIYLIMVLIMIQLVYGATANWINNTADATATDATNFPGQDCSPLEICGELGDDIAQCYDVDSLTIGGINSTYSTNNAGHGGGFLINTNVAGDSASPYCDNTGQFWCERNETCHGSSVYRNTNCTDFGESQCGNCKTEGTDMFDCYGDTDCESTATSDCDSSNNNHYITATCNIGTEGSAGGTCECDTNFFECDGDEEDADGCEIQTGASCGTGATWASNQCVGATGNCTCIGNNHDCDNDDGDNNNETGQSGNECEIEVLTDTNNSNSIYQSCNTFACTSGYNDCNGDGDGANPDGCEIQNGASCTVSGVSGLYSGCSGSSGNCVVDRPPLYAGNESVYATQPNQSLVWARDVSKIGRALLNLTNGSNASFLVNSGGCIVLPQDQANPMCTVPIIIGNCSGEGGCGLITYDTEFSNGTIIRRWNTTWITSTIQNETIVRAYWTNVTYDLEFDNGTISRLINISNLMANSSNRSCFYASNQWTCFYNGSIGAGSPFDPNPLDTINTTLLDNGTIIRNVNTTWITDNQNLIGNCSSVGSCTTVAYVANLVGHIGNWSLDKPNYWNTTETTIRFVNSSWTNYTLDIELDNTTIIRTQNTSWKVTNATNADKLAGLAPSTYLDDTFNTTSEIAIAMDNLTIIRSNANESWVGNAIQNNTILRNETNANFLHINASSGTFTITNSSNITVKYIIASDGKNVMFIDDIGPYTNNSLLLGSNTNQWKEVWAVDFFKEFNAVNSTSELDNRYLQNGSSSWFTTLNVTGNLTAKTKGTATLLVSAWNAPADIIAKADYTCNGTNDSIEIQNAINNLTVGTVKLSSGNFSWGSNISMKSYVNVEGQGMDITYITQSIDPLTSNTRIIQFIDVKGSRLAHLTIDGRNVAVGDYNYQGIRIDNSDDIKIEDVKVQNLDGTDNGAHEGQDGIFFVNMPLRVRILNSFIKNINDDCIDTNNARLLLFQGNQIVSCGDCGIDSDGMAYSQIIDNYFGGSLCWGHAEVGDDSGAIELENDCYNNIVADNIIRNTGTDETAGYSYAIYIEESNENTVVNNQIITVTNGIGIMVKPDSVNNEIYNNYMEDISTDFGINDTSGKINYYGGNVCKGCSFGSSVKQRITIPVIITDYVNATNNSYLGGTVGNDTHRYTWNELNDTGNTELDNSSIIRNVNGSWVTDNEAYRNGTDSKFGTTNITSRLYTDEIFSQDSQTNITYSDTADGYLVVDGDGDYVNSTFIPSLNSTNGSMAVWFNIDSSVEGDSDVLILMGFGKFGNTVDRVEFTRGNDNIFIFRYRAGSTNQNAGGMTDTGFGGSWHHLTGTWNVTHISFYFDGTLNGTATRAKNFSLTNLDNIKIGENVQFNGQAFTGNLDEAMLFNKSLSPTEVALLNNSGRNNKTLDSSLEDFIVYHAPLDKVPDDRITSTTGELIGNAFVSLETVQGYELEDASFSGVVIKETLNLQGTGVVEEGFCINKDLDVGGNVSIDGSQINLNYDGMTTIVATQEDQDIRMRVNEGGTIINAFSIDASDNAQMVFPSGTDPPDFNAGLYVGTETNTRLLDDSSHTAADANIYQGDKVLDKSVPSDERLKKNIVDTSTNLNDLMSLRVVDYEFNESMYNDTGIKTGMLAKEVQPIFPEFISNFTITTRESEPIIESVCNNVGTEFESCMNEVVNMTPEEQEDYLMIEYKEFIPKMIKWMQDLFDWNVEQDTKIQELEERIIVMENMLNISDVTPKSQSNLYYCSTNPSRNETCICLSESKITCYYEICGENTAGNYGRCTGGEWIKIE